MEQINALSQGQMMIVLPKSDLDALVSSINELKDLVVGKAKSEVDAGWIESSEARRLLGVSAKTWQTYRDSRVIPFSQFGRKIYVRRSDLESFLQSHMIKN